MLEVWPGRLAWSPDPVHIHSNTAHPEGGAGTKPTHRQLQIPGVVLAVLNLQARDATKRFREVNAWRGVTHIIAVHDADRRRGIKPDTVCWVALTIRVCIRAHRGEGRKDNRSQQQWKRSPMGRNDFHEINRLRIRNVPNGTCAYMLKLL